MNKKESFGLLLATRHCFFLLRFSLPPRLHHVQCASVINHRHHHDDNGGQNVAPLLWSCR